MLTDGDAGPRNPRTTQCAPAACVRGSCFWMEKSDAGSCTLTGAKRCSAGAKDLASPATLSTQVLRARSVARAAFNAATGARRARLRSASKLSGSSPAPSSSPWVRATPTALSNSRSGASAARVRTACHFGDVPGRFESKAAAQVVSSDGAALTDHASNSGPLRKRRPAQVAGRLPLSSIANQAARAKAARGSSVVGPRVPKIPTARAVPGWSTRTMRSAVGWERTGHSSWLGYGTRRRRRRAKGGRLDRAGYHYPGLPGIQTSLREGGHGLRRGTIQGPCWGQQIGVGVALGGQFEQFP